MVIIAVVLFLGSLVGWAVFVSGQSTERADQWSTVAGLFVNTLLTTGTLVVAWLAWRRPVASAAEPMAAGSVGVGGNSSGEIKTEVTGPSVPDGAGSVRVGRDSSAPITTRVATDSKSQP
jgi:hypothetical protein